MSLCICEAPAPPRDHVTIQPLKTTSIPSVQSNQKVKKAESTPKRKGSTSNSKNSTYFNPRQVVNCQTDLSTIDYEVTGEAAVFNQTEIAFAFMDHGASLDCKNSQDLISNYGEWNCKGRY